MVSWQTQLLMLLTLTAGFTSTASPWRMLAKAPYWVKEPQNGMYTLGKTVRLDCQADGIPRPSITWRINGQLFTEVDEEPRRSVTSGLMTLRDVNIEDIAVYQCEATNVHGSIVINAFLYVVDLTCFPDGVIYKAVDGDDITLPCECSGLPPLYIIWKRQDTVPLLSDPRVSLEPSGTIKLSSVSHNDSGLYTCSRENTNISITAELQVFNRTVILTGPQDVRALRGTSVLLDCCFVVDPRLSGYQVVWRKGDQKLSDSSVDEKYTIFDNSTLRVTDLQLNDTAEYSCEVITDVDKVTAHASITIIDPDRFSTKNWLIRTTCTIGLLVLIVFIITWCKDSEYRGYVTCIFTMCHRHKNYF
ncbi:unnamed protein product [Oreochromis niloticus]|nr:unnamed protein product [Mustela putorius furo]